MSQTIHKGGCLCGAVRFEGKGEAAPAEACHCSNCQKWNGGPAISVSFSEGIEITGEVKWYQSSDYSERGSCPRCGSSLFFRLIDKSYMNVGQGNLDEPDRIRPIEREIYVDQKPECYAFAGDQERLTGPEFLATLGIDKP